MRSHLSLKNRDGYTYSVEDHLGELGEVGVGVVGDDAHGLAVASHVLVKHSNDLLALLAVLLEDVLGAEQTLLLTGVPVELEGVGSLAGSNLLVRDEGTQSLEDGHGARAVVVGTWSLALGVVAVDAVLVSTDSNDLLGLAGDDGTDAGLHPVVLDHLDLGALDVTNDHLGLFHDPLGGLNAGLGVVVAVGVAGEHLKVGLDVVGRDLLEQRLDLGLVADIAGESIALGLGGNAGGLRSVGDVEETNVVLP